MIKGLPAKHFYDLILIFIIIITVETLELPPSRSHSQCWAQLVQVCYHLSVWKIWRQAAGEEGVPEVGVPPRLGLGLPEEGGVSVEVLGAAPTFQGGP